jgi:hypothetical protein
LNFASHRRWRTVAPRSRNRQGWRPYRPSERRTLPDLSTTFRQSILGHARPRGLCPRVSSSAFLNEASPSHNCRTRNAGKTRFPAPDRSQGDICVRSNSDRGVSMSAPLPRGPTDRVEKIRSANASRIKQGEENLLKEFAHLMGADVKAVRLTDRAAGDALGGAQTSPPPVIAVDQPAKQRRTDPSFPISVVDAALVSKKTSSKFRGDVLAVRSSYPH